MSKSRDIADSAATINYIDGLTSDAQSQLNDKATLDGSPTFTGTVTATAFSGDGSGLTGVDSLPSQTGNNGLFLTTDGTAASWGAAGGAWTLLSTVTASAAATANVETTFDSTYDSYVIIGSGIFASGSGGLSIRLKIGGSYLTTGYDAHHIRQTLTSTGYDYGSIANGDRINNASGGDLTTSASTPARIVIELSNPSVSKTQAISYTSNTVQSTSTNDRAYGVGQNRTTGVLTGIQFYGDAGNITGTFRLYGINNS